MTANSWHSMAVWRGPGGIQTPAPANSTLALSNTALPERLCGVEQRSCSGHPAPTRQRNLSLLAQQDLARFETGSRVEIDGVLVRSEGTRIAERDAIIHRVSLSCRDQSRSHTAPTMSVRNHRLGASSRHREQNLVYRWATPAGRTFAVPSLAPKLSTFDRSATASSKRLRAASASGTR